MDLGAHELAQCLIDQAMPLEARAPAKPLRHDVDLEVPALACAGVADMLCTIVANAEVQRCELALEPHPDTARPLLARHGGSRGHVQGVRSQRRTRWSPGGATAR